MQMRLFLKNVKSKVMPDGVAFSFVRIYIEKM